MATTRVRALTRVYENGIHRAPGDEWGMEISLIEPHRAAGQVEIVPQKQAAPAADKQATPSRDKQSRPGQTKTAGQG